MQTLVDFYFFLSYSNVVNWRQNPPQITLNGLCNELAEYIAIFNTGEVKCL